MAEKWFFRIALIGSGRLGSQIAPALEAAGHRVAEIYNPSAYSAEKVAKKLYDCQLVDSLDFSDSSCNLFIITVPDTAISQVASEIVLPDEAIVVHTSGATSLDVLEVTAAENYGILWPLQSFSHDRPTTFKRLPVFVEASNEFTEDALLALASSLGAEPLIVEEEERKTLHLAAVFASNFTNHMLACAKTILGQQNISLEHLQPLVEETVKKAFDLGPEDAQTGPAVREDYETIEEQTSRLSFDESLQRIYQVLSQHIVQSRLGS